MAQVILIVHLIIVLFLIAVVLLQRSEGGALGIGGGGGGVVSGRSAATALQKLTWGLTAAFVATSLILTILATRNSETTSVLDAPVIEESAPVSAPPTLGGDAPATTPNLGE